MKYLISVKTLTLLLFSALVVLACSDNPSGNGEPDPEPEPGSTRYVMITMSENTQTKPGYATVFSEMPEGDVSNVTSSSLQGMGMGGWRPYGNQILKTFKTEANEKGIEELVVTADNQILEGAFIHAGQGKNGSGNFVIADDTKGYYWDADEPLALQIFDPSAMSRTGSIDFSEHVSMDTEEHPGITFQAIGQHFLAVKEGKLYADLTYATLPGAQSGMFDDYFEDVHVAVIDEATGEYEKTITMEDTGGIAYINENEMYDFDSNGDLYIVFQGRSALGGKSKIGRINAGETEFDDWSLDMEDIFPEGKFVTVYADNGKIYTTVPNEPLSGGPTGNINFTEIWEFYVFDAATKEGTKIGGLPASTNSGAAYGIFELDGDILFRVNAPSENLNGYFTLNEDGTSASPLFNVTEGGSVSGLYKIDVEAD